MVIIMHGNPVEGWEFTGPFADHDAAAAWDAKHGGTGFIVTVKEPRGEEVALPDNDYTLAGAGVWLTVGGLSVRVTDNDGAGVRVGVWPMDGEDGAPIAEMRLP